MMEQSGRLALRFDEQDLENAAEEWGCNCGPSALAAVAGLTLEEVRPHMDGFDRKRYTNTRMMFAALDSIGANWNKVRVPFVWWPSWGLVRVQWEGPWSEPGQPWYKRQRHSHWVGSWVEFPADSGGHLRTWVFDMNAIGLALGGWIGLQEWEDSVVPWLLSQCEPEADGQWSVTHAIRVRNKEIEDKAMASLGIR